VGTGIGMAVKFLSKAILARSLGPDQFGGLMIGVTVLYVAKSIGGLGINISVARFIPYYESKSKWRKLKGVISTSLKFSAGASIVIGGVLFIGAEWIGMSIFDNLNLIYVLRVFGVSLPFLTMAGVLRGCIRGFRRMDYIEYTDRGVRQGVILLVAILTAWLGLGIVEVSIGYGMAFAGTALASAFFLVRSHTFFKNWSGIEAKSVTSKLMRFSWPLVARQQLSQSRKRADTLLIGYFATSASAGLYNVALPIAKLLQVVLSSMNRIFMPSISSLYAKGNIERLRFSFQTVARWTLFITLPIYILLIAEGEDILRITFGEEYVGAYVALIILATGFFVNTASGSFGEVLVAIGRTQVVMWMSFIGLAVNITMNIILIPSFKTAGAAIAACISLIVITIIGGLAVYNEVGVHPFSTSYIKVALTGIIPACIIGLIQIQGGWVVNITELALEGAILYIGMFAQLLVVNGLIREEKTALKRLKVWAGFSKING
jgi:O-antigen/teichoic acid export membrane protein